MSRIVVCVLDRSMDSHTKRKSLEEFSFDTDINKFILKSNWIWHVDVHIYHYAQSYKILYNYLYYNLAIKLIVKCLKIFKKNESFNWYENF